MGIGVSILTLIMAFGAMFIMLLREIYFLNRTLDHNEKSNQKLQERLSEELASVEIEKIFLEDRINQLEEKIVVWRSQSLQLSGATNILQRRSLNAGFEDDETRKSRARFRSAS